MTWKTNKYLFFRENGCNKAEVYKGPYAHLNKRPIMSVGGATSQNAVSFYLRDLKNFKFSYELKKSVIILSIQYFELTLNSFSK